MTDVQLPADGSENLPYKAVAVGNRYTVVQEDETGRRVFTAGLYWDSAEVARQYAADLEHLRTQIPGQLTLFDSALNPSLEAQ